MANCTKPNFSIESLRKFLTCWVYSLPLVLSMVIGCERDVSSEGKDGQAEASRIAIEMEVHFGESAETKSFEIVVDRQSPTVLDAMKRAEEAGKLVFAYRGNGKFAFLEAIDMTINQGSDGDNWVYSVNGVQGNKSFGVYRVETGDRIEWRFGAYDADK